MFVLTEGASGTAESRRALAHVHGEAAAAVIARWITHGCKLQHRTIHVETYSETSTPFLIPAGGLISFSFLFFLLFQI